MLIIKVVSTIIVTFFSLCISSILLKKRINFNNRETIISLIIMVVSVYFVHLIFANFIRILINFVFISLAYKFIFKESILRCFLVGFAVMMCLFLAEIIFGLLLVLVLPININQINQSWSGFLFANLFIGFTAYLIVLYPPFMKFLLRLVNKAEEAKYIEFIFIMIIAIGLLSNKNILVLGANIEYLINICLIVLFSTIVYYYFKEKEYRTKLSLEYKQLFCFMDRYEKEITSQNLIIHEFKNQLIAIKGFIDDGDQGINDYLKGLVDSLKTNTPKMIKDIDKVPGGALKGLIYYKLGRLHEEKFKLHIDIKSNAKRDIFNKLKPSVHTDIIKIIGVLFDNAIEAARDSEEKEIALEMDFKKNFFSLELSNTYDKKKFIKNKGGNSSTKGKGRGYGLILVDRLLKKHNFIQYHQTSSSSIYNVYLDVSLGDDTS